jgi:hypothetical protein
VYPARSYDRLAAAWEASPHLTAAPTALGDLDLHDSRLRLVEPRGRIDDDLRGIRTNDLFRRLRNCADRRSSLGCFRSWPAAQVGPHGPGLAYPRKSLLESKRCDSADLLEVTVEGQHAARRANGYGGDQAVDEPPGRDATGPTRPVQAGGSLEVGD